MRVTIIRAVTLAAALSRTIGDRCFGRLLTGQVRFLSLPDIDPTKSTPPQDRTLSRQAVVGLTPHEIRPPFTWRHAAHRGLALLAGHPDAILEKDQQDRLGAVLTMLLQEGTKDAYMVWEDFRNIDTSRQLSNQNHWLQAIVRHLRHGLRLRNLYGPEISDDKFLSAFGRWDENITRTLHNVNRVVTAAQPVAGIPVVLPSAWRTIFSLFGGLISADQQILSCYGPYWNGLSWPNNTLAALASYPGAC